MFKRYWTLSSNINYYSTLNNTIKDLSIQLRNQQKNALLMTITKLGEVRFSIWFLHMFHYSFTNGTWSVVVYLIDGRSWRTWKTNQIASTFLTCFITNRKNEKCIIYTRPPSQKNKTFFTERVVCKWCRLFERNFNLKISESKIPRNTCSKWGWYMLAYKPKIRPPKMLTCK